jgi:hypothetical protein
MDAAEVPVGLTSGAELPDGYRSAFVHVSALLTGFDAIDLEGTGLVDQYAALYLSVLDTATGVMFVGELRALEAANDHVAAIDNALVSDVVGPLLTNLVTLWYLGAWQQLPDSFWTATGRPRPAGDISHIPSSLAYEQGLAWRVACAHPPGARPTGYGGWALAPVVPVDDLPPIARGRRHVAAEPTGSTVRGATT